MLMQDHVANECEKASAARLVALLSREISYSPCSAVTEFRVEFIKQNSSKRLNGITVRFYLHYFFSSSFLSLKVKENYIQFFYLFSTGLFL